MKPGCLLFLLGWLVPLVAAQEPGALELELVTKMPEGVKPLAVRHAGDGRGRLFILDQAGRISIHDGDRLLARPFLDIRRRVASGGEKGLLGLAFSPHYGRDGRFYVNYTLRRGRRLFTRISRFRVSAEDPNLARAGSEEPILEVEQPWGNHNGGDLHFGPDGYLYIGLGDGGAAGDPRDNARNLRSLLGKMLRIDVEGRPAPGDEICGRRAAYGIPPDNPFRGHADSCDEIWARGLRNPWRWSFDRLTGDLFVADVGQDAWEEVNFQPGSSRGGEHYGWSCKEGNHPYEQDRCDDGPMVSPVLEYGHEQGHCSITGGYRYRGPVEALRGLYVYADFCSGEVWFARRTEEGWRASPWRRTGLNVSSFGEDEAGNLYLVHLGGEVYRFAH